MDSQSGVLEAREGHFASRKRKFEKTLAAAEASRKDKVLLWRKFARGKGKQAWPKVHCVNFAQLNGWLKARRLSDRFALQGLKRTDLAEMHLPAGVQILWGSYRNVTAPVSAETSGWLPAYHGTWFYGLWSILHHGIFLESTDEGRGHEFSTPGVYVTRRFETAREYARPHQLFSDGTFYRCVVKVRYDPQEVRKQKSKGGDQVVVPSCAVVIEGVFFCANDPPTKGEERFEDWQDELEVIPYGIVPTATERLAAVAALEVTVPPEAPVEAEVDAEAVPLFWRVDLPEVLKVLSQPGVLPSNFLPVVKPYVALLYLRGHLPEHRAASRCGMTLQQFRSAKQALEKLQGKQVAVKMTEIIIEENVACAVVELPKGVPAGKIPHLTLGTRENVPAQHAYDVLEEILSQGRTEGITRIKLPKAKELLGVLDLETSDSYAGRK